jgi:hypothetical protein
MPGLLQIARTPFLIRTFLKNINYQQRFLKSHLGKLLDEAEKNSDGTLDESDFKKIYKYYGLAVPAILGEEFAVLRGKPLSERERLALSYQGAMTGLVDDFFDRRDMSEEKLLAFINDPDIVTPSNSGERLFLHLFKKSMELTHHPSLTQHYLPKVYLAQVASIAQERPGLSKDELKKLTIDKGGSSLLYYRSVMENPFIAKEEEAFYLVGGMTQFGNDIFDVYKDTLHDIRTLMSTTTRVNDVRNDFRQLQAKVQAAFYETGYAKKNIREFLRMVSLSLCSRCYVCLDQLEAVEKKYGGSFTPREYSRKELVCDMDTSKNKWRSLKHFWRQKY